MITSEEVKKLSERLANELLMFADGSNYGTLEELQEALIWWSMDLYSGAKDIMELIEDET